MSQLTVVFESAGPASGCAPAFLRLMGDFHLTIAGQDCSSRLNYEKVRLMLAVLALAQSRPVSRAKLASMIWPDVEVTDGRARVRHALHTLRQVFSALPEALEVDTTRIRLRTDLVQVDVLSLLDDPSTPFQIDDEQRLDWYRPPLLETQHAPPTEEFQNWLQGWRARIEIEMAQWRQRAIDRYMKESALSLALTQATRWAEKWPEDESCHRMLIRLLVATGQHDAAMLAFEQCSRILGDRLGLAPSAETKALLGLETSTAVNTLVKPRRYGREFRPLAVLAVTLSWPSAQREAEVAVESLELARRDALAVIQASGAWVVHAGGGSLLAYCGYPGVTERPIDAAVALARALSGLTLHEGVHLGMGLHAEVALTEPEMSTPDAAALLSQTALPLSWHARHRETLLSKPAVLRLEPRQLLTLKRGGRTDHLLEYHPQSEVTPRLHGRSREFDFLVGLWMRQLPGRLPTVVTLTGFPGIGKSLLASALAEYAVQSDGQRILLECEEASSSVPLFPVLKWLRQQRDAVAEHLPGVTGRAITDRLCDMLGLKSAQSEGLGELLDATQVGGPLLREAQDILIAILARHGVDTQQPRLIVFENLQWADPATLALIQQIGERPARMPLMVICTSRANPPGTAEQTLRLGPLNEMHMAEFVSHRSRKHRLSRKQREHVLQLSHGVPLYALLLMRQTINDLPLDHSCRLTDTLCLAMRRLPPAALEAAQLAALMDARPDVCTLGRVLAMSEDVARAAISCLLDAGILMETAKGELESPVIVKLALERMTPRKTRQRLHTLIARHLIDTDALPDRIALHVEQADESSTPIWWQRAAIQEIREHQPRRARASLERALKHAHRIDTSEARRQFEFECQLILGELAAATIGPGAERTLHAYEAASRLTPVDDPHAALLGLWGKWLSCQHTARYTEALDLARRHMRLAIELDIDEVKGWSHYAIGQTYLWCGQLAEAEQALDQSIAVLSTADVQEDVSSVYGGQAIALVYATQALCVALQGRAEQAEAQSRMAVQMAMAGGAPVTLAGCLLLSARIHYLADNVQAAAAICQGLMSHMPQHDPSDPWYALIHAYAVLPKAMEGGNSDALAQLQGTLPVIQVGMPTLLNSVLCMIARGLIAQNLFGEAAAALAQAEEINHSQNSYTVEPEIDCLRGDLWQASGQLQQAHAAWNLARASALRRGLLPYVAWADARGARYPAMHAAL